MKTLVWFRNDLRIGDNPALFHAADAGQGVIGVFVWCEEYISRHSIAPARVDFIRRNLLLLIDDLKQLYIPLRLISVKQANDIPKVLLRLAQQEQCSRLLFNAEYPLDEWRRDAAVVAGFRAAGLATKRYHDRVLIPPGMIRNNQGEPYKVFTAFKRKWLETLMPANPQPLGNPQAQRKSRHQYASPQEVNTLFTAAVQRDLTELWPAGETEARARLATFMREDIDHYHERRDFPAIEGTSSLSPYLAIGAISPRQCLVAALAANAGEWNTGHEGATCWINELIWRDFYQHVVVDFPHVCQHKAMQAHTEVFPWRRDKADFERWCQGRTGIPLVDAAMRQLLETGWMHNRLRMVVAMFLTKNLQIDWRWGEVFFMQQLIDGDFAANNGGWQWSASTGTDAAPYFRIFNPVSQSLRFDSDGEFIRRYLPELAGLSNKAIHFPPPSSGYIAPMVDLVVSRKQTIALFAQLNTA